MREGQRLPPRSISQMSACVLAHETNRFLSSGASANTSIARRESPARISAG